MLLTDKQLSSWMDWFIEKYEPHCCRTLDWRLDIPIIYSEDPNKTETEHAEMWRNKLRELMWKSYDKGYVHRGWRKDTLWEAQFQSLRLYNWPIFKSIKEKENETNKHWTTWLKEIWDIQWWEWEEQETAWAEEYEE